MRKWSVGPGCVLVWLALASTAVAQEPATAPAERAREERPSAVAVRDLSDLARGAAEVEARLRHLRESLAETRSWNALEERAAELSQRVTDQWRETTEVLKLKPRPIPLDSLSSSWIALRQSLEEVLQHVDVRAKRRESDLEQLTQMHESWSQALQLARDQTAPAAFIDRMQATVSDIDAMRGPIQERRAHLLALQDAATRSMQSSDDALERIREARRDAVERILDERRSPIWDFAPRSDEPLVDASGARLYSRLGADVLRSYSDEHRVGLAATVAIGVFVALLLRRARAWMATPSGRAATLAPAAWTLETPIAAAILLTIVLTRPLRPHPPAILMQLVFAVGMLSAVVVIWRVGSAAVRRLTLILAGLFFLDVASQILATSAPRIEQLVSVFEKTVAGASILWFAGRVRDPQTLPSASPQWRSALRTLLIVFAVACLAAAVAAAAGWLDFADYLGGAVLDLLFAGVALMAFRLAARGLVAVALVSPPLGRLRALAHDRALVERRAMMVVDLVAVSVWIWVGLYRFEVLDWAGDALGRAFGARMQIGDFDLAIGRVLGFFTVVVVAYLTTRIVVFLLQEEVYSRMELPRGVPYALSTLTRYALLLAGFMVALGTLGIDLTKITVLVSAFGIGIGFGLQQVINNFVSGLILLFERPVQVGDSIQMGDLGGEITRIGIRSSTVATPDGAEVIVPNSKIIEDRVTNWTLSDRRRRIDLELSVDSGGESERILQLLVDVAGRDERVCAQPAPEALLAKFGEKSAEFCLRVWTDDPNWMRVRSDLGIAIQRGLRDLRAGDA